jgi:hypothetical protein
LGAGLALGFGLALWLELRDKSIRTEEDVLAALEMPMLVSVPWIGSVTNGNGSWKNRFKQSAEEDGEKIEV